MSLYEKVTGWMTHQQVKHNLGANFVKDTLENMSRDQFLRAVSEALEEVLEERGVKK